MKRLQWTAIMAVVIASACAGDAPRLAMPTRPEAKEPASLTSAAPEPHSDGGASNATTASVACGPIDPSRYELPPYDETVFTAALPPIVDPSSRVMTPLYEKLAALLRGRTTDPVRIGIYGDSTMTEDGISGGMRRMLQGKLGDAGHGYVALGRAWPWYLHLDVKHGASYSKWKAYSTSVDHAPDGRYGFANMAFDSLQAGATTYAETADDDSPVGRAVSRFDAYFLKRPGAGSFTVKIDGVDARVVSTTSATPLASFERFDVPDGPHRFEIVVNAGAPVRVFGVTLERDVPGVVVDSLGTGALNYVQMTKVEGSTRRAMLERRRYDLVMFLLGANIFSPSEAMTTGWIDKVVQAHREAVPNLPIVLMSPPDIAASMDAKKSDPRIVGLVYQMRRAAVATKSAFWDFWSAMGGDLSIVRLRRKPGMASSDLVHLTRKAGAMMGQRMAHALMNDFTRYVTEHPDAGCGALPDDPTQPSADERVP